MVVFLCIVWVFYYFVSADTCSTARDCGGTTDCRFGWHCVDAVCRCGFGIGGIGK